jgi:hypothetical protein
MNKEFIPYEQALALKELGFDEICLAMQTICGLQLFSQRGFAIIKGGYTNTELKLDGVLGVPLYQQAFRWFREKYNLYHNVWNYTHGEPTNLIPNGFTYSIDEEWITIIGKKEDGYFEKYYNTYEEAEQACLSKLIEIVKNK